MDNPCMAFSAFSASPSTDSEAAQQRGRRLNGLPPYWKSSPSDIIELFVDRVMKDVADAVEELSVALPAPDDSPTTMTQEHRQLITKGLRAAIERVNRTTRAGDPAGDIMSIPQYPVGPLLDPPRPEGLRRSTQGNRMMASHYGYQGQGSEAMVPSAPVAHMQTSMPLHYTESRLIPAVAQTPVPAPNMQNNWGSRAQLHPAPMAMATMPGPSTSSVGHMQTLVPVTQAQSSLGPAFAQTPMAVAPHPQYNQTPNAGPRPQVNQTPTVVPHPQYSPVAMGHVGTWASGALHPMSHHQANTASGPAMQPFAHPAVENGAVAPVRLGTMRNSTPIRATPGPNTYRPILPRQPAQVQSSPIGPILKESSVPALGSAFGSRPIRVEPKVFPSAHPNN